MGHQPGETFDCRPHAPPSADRLLPRISVDVQDLDNLVALEVAFLADVGPEMHGEKRDGQPTWNACEAI
jgi:hypothetical protein